MAAHGFRWENDFKSGWLLPGCSCGWIWRPEPREGPPDEPRARKIWGAHVEASAILAVTELPERLGAIGDGLAELVELYRAGELWTQDAGRRGVVDDPGEEQVGISSDPR